MKGELIEGRTGTRANGQRVIVRNGQVVPLESPPVAAPAPAIAAPQPAPRLGEPVPPPYAPVPQNQGYAPIPSAPQPHSILPSWVPRLG